MWKACAGDCGIWKQLHWKYHSDEIGHKTADKFVQICTYVINIDYAAYVDRCHYPVPNIRIVPFYSKTQISNEVLIDLSGVCAFPGNHAAIAVRWWDFGCCQIPLYCQLWLAKRVAVAASLIGSKCLHYRIWHHGAIWRHQNSTPGLQAKAITFRYGIWGVGVRWHIVTSP